jgi:hypothetical protein
MLFSALAITLAGFTGLGFSNPDQAWARALKDDRETGAPQAAQPAPEVLLVPHERSMPARVPERIPTSTHGQVREPTLSSVPSSMPPSMHSPMGI